MSGARDIAFRAAVMAAIGNHAYALKDRYRSELSGMMANGDRLSAVDPAHPERKIGKAVRQDAKPKAVITDRAALAQWMALRYLGDPRYGHYIQAAVEPDPARKAEAVKVLREHAPHLLIETHVVPPWAEAEVIRSTVEAGEACSPTGETGIPGVTYVPPGEGTVVVTPCRDAMSAIEHLWREGRIDITTGELLAIEVGKTTR